MTPLLQFCHIFKLVSGQLPPHEKIAPQLGLGFGSRLGLVLGLGGNQTSAPEENCPLLALGFWLGLVLRLRAIFLGAIVLEPFKLTDRKDTTQ